MWLDRLRLFPGRGVALLRGLFFLEASIPVVLLLSLCLSFCGTLARGELLNIGGGKFRCSHKKWTLIVHPQSKSVKWRPLIQHVEQATGITSQIIAVLICSFDHEDLIAGQQLNCLCCWQFGDISTKDRISCDHSSPALLSRTSFAIPRPRHRVKLMRGCYGWKALGWRHVDNIQYAPVELGRKMSAIVEIDHYSRLVSGLPGNVKFGDYTILPPDGHISALANLQSILHCFPLLLGIGHVDEREHDYRHRGQGGDSPVILVQETDYYHEPSRDEATHRYNHSHPIPAMLVGLAGVLFLVIGAGSWGTGVDCNVSDTRQAVFAFLGVIVFTLGLWFIYQALGLAVFKVAPCASLTPFPHAFSSASVPAHSDFRSVAMLLLQSPRACPIRPLEPLGAALCQP